MCVSSFAVNVPDSIVTFETLLPSSKKAFCLDGRSGVRPRGFQ